MKKDSAPSSKPSASQTGPTPESQQAHEAGQGSQKQHEMSNNTPGQKPKNAQQQGGATPSNSRQEQADTGSNKNSGNKDSKSNGNSGDSQQISPSRDQGHSTSGSSDTSASGKRSDSKSPRQTGESH